MAVLTDIVSVFKPKIELLLLLQNLKGQVCFIATQGPTKETKEDFIRMLVENNTKLLITIIAYASIGGEMQKVCTSIAAFSSKVNLYRDYI